MEGFDEIRCRVSTGELRSGCSRRARRRLKTEANLLIMLNVDSVNIAFDILKVAGGESITVSPILLGAAKAVHIPDADGERAPHRQHDGTGGGRRRVGARLTRGS